MLDPRPQATVLRRRSAPRRHLSRLASLDVRHGEVRGPEVSAERPAATTPLWVEVTLRLPQDEFVHPEIVRDDLLDALPFTVETASVTDTSPGYMELAS